MESRQHDNLLWLGLSNALFLVTQINADTSLAVIGLFAIRATVEQLHRVRTATEITHVEKPSRVISQDAEDGETSPLEAINCGLSLEALKLGTLQKLAQGPNFDLRAA